MKFSKDYSKLDFKAFTTIRKRSLRYSWGGNYKIETPTREFRATVRAICPIKKINITESLALADADCSRGELITMLEKWYGKDFDDFMLLVLEEGA